MRARLVQLLLAWSFAGVLLVSASAGTAYACDCAIGEPEDNLLRADLAFEGIVAAIVLPPSVPGQEISLDPIAVTFVIDSVLKWTPGGSPDEVTVFTANNSAACGVSFSTGERWRIFATIAPGGSPETGLCSGDELLGQGTVPARAPTGPPLTLLIAAGVAVALVAFSAWAFTRRPRGESA